METKYFKVVGLTVDALSAEIVADGNVKDIIEATVYINQHIENNENATWLVFPCSCKM